MLGLIIDTNRLTVAIPAKPLQEIIDQLNFTWHPNQHRFKVSEAQKLTGKLARLAKIANWVFHLLSLCICQLHMHYLRTRDSLLSHL
jgi:hypothetical protein